MFMVTYRDLNSVVFDEEISVALSIIGGGIYFEHETAIDVVIASKVQNH